jgi:hypothetical protein
VITGAAGDVVRAPFARTQRILLWSSGLATGSEGKRGGSGKQETDTHEYTD